ncbi:MAG: DNA mismatch repair protein MutS, partial [Alphaproteobacteria bacterium]|nr:DNA mismatch repair protein MutS [Alphaproteobacteria bacterium]
MRKTDTLSTKERKESADKGTSTPMMVQYFEIKNKYPDYLVFYRLGDFYELFFEDAEKASKALDLVLTKRGKNNGQDIPMCGVPFHAYENYLAKLVKCGFKVAICEQVETPEEAKKRGGSSALVKREVSRLVTPGTLTESALLDAKKHNFLLSIVKNKNTYSIAWVDVSTGDFFTETDTEKKLCSALFSLEPSEVLLPQELRETVFLKETLEELHTKVTYLSVALCSAKSAQERMESLFKVSSLESFGTFLPSELCAAGELLSYIELTQQGLFPQLMPLKKVISSEFMEIDAATCRNLELFHSLSTTGKGKSLLDIIDKTTTNGGSRLLKSFLRTPLLQTNLIEERLDSVDFFLNEYTLSLKLKEALKQVPDIERSLARLAVQRGGPRDLAAIRRVLLLLPSLK